MIYEKYANLKYKYGNRHFAVDITSAQWDETGAQ